MIEGIPNPSRTADNILETSLTPIELLDVLGFSGHRVVGVSSKNNKMVNNPTVDFQDDVEIDNLLDIQSSLFSPGVDS